MAMKGETVYVCYCDFCGKTAREVETMIAAPNDVMICNECVEVCVAELARRRAPVPETANAS